MIQRRHGLFPDGEENACEVFATFRSYCRSKSTLLKTINLTYHCHLRQIIGTVRKERA